jgi:hypothetical protein
MTFDIFPALRAEASRKLAHGWTLAPSPTEGERVAVLTLRDGTQIRGRADIVLNILRGLPDVARA